MVNLWNNSKDVFIIGTNIAAIALMMIVLGNEKKDMTKNQKKKLMKELNTIKKEIVKKRCS